MQKLKNKTIAIAIAIFLMFSMSASVMLIPNASAHTPAWQIPTYAYITVTPNPVGLSQSVFIDMWLDKVLPGAELGDNVRYANYELTITAPDGTKTTMTWAVVSDPTANQDYSYTPAQVGTYTLNFTFPGQVYSWTQPVPSLFGPPAPSPYVGDTFLSSSASVTLTVQQTPIATLPTTPLPTAYWTRPIYGENPDWYTISSNWLGRNAPGYSNGYGIASGIGSPSGTVGSQTGHIMWTKPLQSGGVVGGNSFVIAGDTYTDGSAYALRYTNPIIMDGMLYYTEPVSEDGPSSGPTVCVNLQTGQQIWSSSTMPAPSFGYIYDVQDPNQHGVYPPILIASSGGMSPFGYMGPELWQAFDADTGDALFNVTNIPQGTAAVGVNGEYLILSLTNDAAPESPPQYYLSEWNSSRLWDDLYSGASTTPTNVPPILDGSWAGGYMMTMFGPTYEPSLYDWNVSISSLNTWASSPIILAAYTNNMLICMNGTFPNFPGAFNSVNSWAPYTYFALNLNATNGAVGTVLWKNTLNAPAGNMSVAFAGADPTADGGKGVFVESYYQTMQFVGYSMATGQKLWGPIGGNQVALNFFEEGVPMAYGNLYSIGYGGVLYCYDLTNGNLLWTYGNGGEGNTTNTDLAAPFPYYPAVIGAVGNGIVYMVTSEHDTETPIYKGALARAVNATTGKEIWTLSNMDNGLGVGNPGYAIADGYSTFFNAYDNQIYVVGRGPSDTKVQAPLTAITEGNNVVIQGTVMDISAGATQTEQAADFPNGVPCASDASMTQWMGYVYQQQPLPTNFTGVTVQLSAIDPNGNHIIIGDATTNVDGVFDYTWTTPNVPGSYSIFATFAGTNGYWGSNANTGVDVVSAAPTPAPTATPVTGLATMSALTYGIVAVIIVIIVAIAIVGLLLLRKKP